jgi:hypothetical protein
MRVIQQKIEEIFAELQPLTVDWQDDVSHRVIEELHNLPIKPEYTVSDVKAILDKNFEDGMLMCRLFLGLSKDQFAAAIRTALGASGGAGVTRYKNDQITFVNALVNLGLLESMDAQVNRPLLWSDVLVERLRSGRGSAISGQKRGKDVEDFAEEIVKQVFGEAYEMRRTFTGKYGKTAKCDIAIPSTATPRILIEAKGYGATGSKMTDVIGDIEKIISAKRDDTCLLFFTDGLTWKQRRNDFRKIVGYQNEGHITRIYCTAMAAQFKEDLQQLKHEFGL